MPHLWVHFLFIYETKRNKTPLPVSQSWLPQQYMILMCANPFVNLDRNLSVSGISPAHCTPLTINFTLSLSKIYGIVNIIFIGVSNDWYATLDMLKESCRIASSVNWSDVDLSQFQGEYWFFLTYNQIHVILFSPIGIIFSVVEINIS